MAGWAMLPLSLLTCECTAWGIITPTSIPQTDQFRHSNQVIPHITGVRSYASNIFFISNNYISIGWITENGTSWNWNIIWAVTCAFQQCGILTSVDSDEPVQPRFKLRNSKWCSVNSLKVIKYSSDQQRLWSDCAYAQADLRLCWSHIPHCWKSHVTTLLQCVLHVIQDKKTGKNAFKFSIIWQKETGMDSEVQISFQFNWVFTPLDFYELLFSKNNCLKIFFLPLLDFWNCLFISILVNHLNNNLSYVRSTQIEVT